MYPTRGGCEVVEVGNCAASVSFGSEDCPSAPMRLNLISSSTDLLTSAVIWEISSGSTVRAKSDLSKATLIASCRGAGCFIPPTRIILISSSTDCLTSATTLAMVLGFGVYLESKLSSEVFLGSF